MKSNSSRSSTQKLVFAGLLAAMTAVATLLIVIPTPTKGYINLGDCFVNIGAWLMGPVYGTAAAATGSAMADLIAGYGIYAPATFVIKGLMALASYAVFSGLKNSGRKKLSPILAALIAEIVMVAGYAIYESILYGSFATALTGVPSNAIQGIGNIVIAEVLYAGIIGKCVPAGLKKLGRHSGRNI
ncbi:MAG: ECF transporter S component [Ruminococcus sp.]|nr:ECF transporter S component [Ruminococcus sp.]